MSEVGKIQRVTQNRIIELFRDELGYRYLGNWEEREGNSNIRETLLVAYSDEAGYSTDQISRALDTLRREINDPSRTLYANNQAVYSKLRYAPRNAALAAKADQLPPKADYQSPRYGLQWTRDDRIFTFATPSNEPAAITGRLRR